MPDVTIREAAARLGVSVDTVRRRIKSGALPATKGPRAADPYIVHLEDAAGASAAHSPDIEGTATARELIDSLRRQVEFQERQIADLHRLLDQAHRLLPMAPEGEVREPAAEPQASWWRRLFGQG